MTDGVKLEAAITMKTPVQDVACQVCSYDNMAPAKYFPPTSRSKSMF